ncbi:MAG: right-handed parallel beta-helix repeat-containing protein, partial [Planctomycetota bacterium]
MRKFLSLVTAGLLLALPPLAWAATIKVTPEDDLQDVIDAAEDGDTIIIGPGNYSQTVQIDGRTGLTIKGQGSPVFMAGDDWAFEITESTGISLSGVVITESDVGVVIEDSTDTTVSGVEISDSDSEAIQMRDSTGTTITKCTLTDAGGEGIWEQNTTDSVITRNTISGVQSSGMWLSVTGTESGIVDAVISKNTIRDTGGWGFAFAATGLILEKNVVDMAGDRGIFTDSTTTSSGCVIQKNTFN